MRGYGPEIVTQGEPCSDRYRIWVSDYEDKNEGSTRARVRVYVRGYLIAEASHVLDRRTCHWLVGEVMWDGDDGHVEYATEDNYICGMDNPEQGASCSSDLDCHDYPDQVCWVQECRPGCHLPGSPLVCTAPQTCDATTGRCESSDPCTGDADCNPPMSRCDEAWACARTAAA